MKGKRILIAALVAVALAGGGYWYWQNSQTTNQPAIMSSMVERGDIEVSVLASGTLRPARLAIILLEPFLCSIQGLLEALEIHPLNFRFSVLAFLNNTNVPWPHGLSL